MLQTLAKNLLSFAYPNYTGDLDFCEGGTGRQVEPGVERGGGRGRST